MVLPAKIFEVKGDVDTEQVLDNLRDFREEETYEMVDEETLNLLTQILDIKHEEDILSGVFSKDIMREHLYRRRVTETPTTEEAPFWITPFEDRHYMIVSAPSVARGVKKLLTNHVANRLSEVLYNKVGFVVESRIPSTVLQVLHESNPQATNLIWFDDVDIPSVEKLCLAGSSLADTGLYHDYLDHGKIWYVVFETRRRGITVGITRGCVVTLFSKLTMDNFVKYIIEDLLTLIE